MPEGERSLHPATSREGPADADLVACCRIGDEGAWSALIDRFSRYVYAISVQGFRLTEADAEDVFQEVFARTYQHLDRLRDDAAIRPWLGQLTRRLCVDRLREMARVGVADDLDPAAAEGQDSDAIARVDAALDVREALAVLTDDCQEILDRFFARDQSYRIISETLEIPQGTIASRISRCLVKLRTELEGRTAAGSPS